MIPDSENETNVHKMNPIQVQYIFGLLSLIKQTDLNLTFKVLFIYVCCTDDCLQEVMQQPEPAIALLNLPSFSHIVRQFKASGGLTNMFVMQILCD